MEKYFDEYMEKYYEQYAQRITKQLITGYIQMFKIPIRSLGQMVMVLDKHKSEYPQIIATYKSLLLRKFQVEKNKSHSYSLERMYYEMVHQNKDKAEAQRFKAWFQKLRRVKSYSIIPNKYFTSLVYIKIEEETEDMRVNFRQLEKLMRENLHTFTQTIRELMREHRVKFYRMPVEHLSHFIEELAKYKNMPRVCQELKITLAYKKEYLNLLSEEEIQKNKIFLEERYQSLVKKNPDRDEAEFFRYIFQLMERLDQEHFEDGLYIRGKLLRMFKAKIETSSGSVFMISEKTQSLEAFLVASQLEQEKENQKNNETLAKYQE